LIEMIKNLPESERQVFEPKVENLLEVYGELSKTYQASKETTDIPLS